MAPERIDPGGEPPAWGVTKPTDDASRIARAEERLRGVRTVLDIVGALRPADLSARIEAAAREHRSLRPFALVADVLILIVQGLLIILTNWRLMLLQLVPGAWLSILFWDWRTLVITGQPAFAVDHWPIPIAVVVLFLGTGVSYWCNVAFASSLLAAPPDVRAGARRATESWLVVATAAAGFTALHVVMAHRAATTEVGTFALGIGLVVTVQIFMYTLLPAQVLSLGRSKLTWRSRLGKSLIGGVVALVAAAPGFALSRIGELMFAVKSLRELGRWVLALAVLVQLAGVSSTRAVSASTSLLARRDDLAGSGGGSGSGPVTQTAARPTA